MFLVPCPIGNPCRSWPPWKTAAGQGGQAAPVAARIRRPERRPVSAAHSDQCCYASPESADLTIVWTSEEFRYLLRHRRFRDLRARVGSDMRKFRIVDGEGRVAMEEYSMGLPARRRFLKAGAVGVLGVASAAAWSPPASAAEPVPSVNLALAAKG